jgi:hypothetical protein
MSASAYRLYQEDNPFVEAMLRMMEIFGLIDRSSLPLGVPYLPSYSPSMPTGLGGIGSHPGLPGMSPWSGLGGYPGMGMPPGMSGWPGPGAYPGMGQFPGAGGWPGWGVGGYPGNWINSGAYGQTSNAAQSGYLDGIWELSSDGFVIIRRNAARLYLESDRYQDFLIGYDRQRFWWTPRGGNTTTTYRYQMRDGRMILRDNQGNVLLMRRRR